MKENDARRKRKVGRPPWASQFDTKVDVRISAKEDRMLNELSRRHGETRSNIMRKALNDFYKFNTLDEEDV